MVISFCVQTQGRSLQISPERSNFHLITILALQVDISIYQLMISPFPKSFTFHPSLTLPGQLNRSWCRQRSAIFRRIGPLLQCASQPFVRGFAVFSDPTGSLRSYLKILVLNIIITILRKYNIWKHYWSVCQFNIDLKLITSTCEIIDQYFLMLSNTSIRGSKTKCDVNPTKFHYKLETCYQNWVPK